MPHFPGRSLRHKPRCSFSGLLAPHCAPVSRNSSARLVKHTVSPPPRFYPWVWSRAIGTLSLGLDPRAKLRSRILVTVGTNNGEQGCNETAGEIKNGRCPLHLLPKRSSVPSEPPLLCVSSCPQPPSALSSIPSPVYVFRWLSLLGACPEHTFSASSAGTHLCLQTAVSS